MDNTQTQYTIDEAGQLTELGRVYDDIDHQRAECVALRGTVADLRSILLTLTDHASEMYPHFESERGQREIAQARAIIAKVQS
jgi:hypothetical protein